MNLKKLLFEFFIKPKARRLFVFIYIQNDKNLFPELQYNMKEIFDNIEYILPIVWCVEGKTYLKIKSILKDIILYDDKAILNLKHKDEIVRFFCQNKMKKNKEWKILKSDKNRFYKWDYKFKDGNIFNHKTQCFIYHKLKEEING